MLAPGGHPGDGLERLAAGVHADQFRQLTRHPVTGPEVLATWGRSSRSGSAAPAGASYLASVSCTFTTILACYPYGAGQTPGHRDLGGFAPQFPQRGGRRPLGDAGPLAGSGGSGGATRS